MEDSLNAALSALSGFTDPVRLALLFVGVLSGLVIGILPGLGGIVGLSLFLPFTFYMEPAVALSMLIGLHAVVATSDAIPAILFGVPGTVGSAATVLDGYPMTRKGKAGRALSAAFLSSLLGGLFGAAALALSIPVMRPVILSVGSPEMLALCLLGLSLVAVLSGHSKLGGLVAVSLGLLLSMVGEDYQSGTLRWTFDSIYLWSGIPLVPFALGLFAFPEVADMVVRRANFGGGKGGDTGGWRDGTKDVLANRSVVMRSSLIGALLGVLPGIGSAIIDWVAYGSALKNAKDSSQFGKGDVRGVIASEASNNAKEGGALVPTLAFGVPGSAGMAILLVAFSIHGIVPGPEMLGSNLDITFSIIFSLALANVLAAGLCFLFARRIAKIALIPVGFMVPVVISVVVLGALQAEKHWADLGVFFAAGLLGMALRLLGWPRPPLILGFVLGPLVERYMATSYNIYGLDFLFRPIFLLIAALGLWWFFWPIVVKLFRSDRTLREKVSGPARKTGGLGVTGVASLIAAAFFAFALVTTFGWNSAAAAAPKTVAVAGILFALSLAVFRWIAVERRTSAITGFNGDFAFDRHGMPSHEFTRRLLHYCVWTMMTVPISFVLGPVPGVALWCFVYMHYGHKVPWRAALLTSASIGLLAHFLFDRVLNVVWPQSLVALAIW